MMRRLPGWVGRKDRQSVAIDAVVHRSDGSTVAVKLTDVSEEGCRLEGDDTLAIGEMVQIAVARLAPVKAQVRWALPGSAGTRFLDDSEA
jgi:hypothetical protein